MRTKRILLILTGGTICSFATSRGEQAPDTKRAEALIIQKFRESNSPYKSEECVCFDAVAPLDVLSENMTTLHWNVLIDALRSYDFSAYDGVIMLHGTDTLAYSAAMLSIVLSGLSVPLILVSSQLTLANPMANGVANFCAAVELILNGIKPNVYVTYRNEERIGNTFAQTMYVHYAAHLTQCAGRSNNFYSDDMTVISQENAHFIGVKSPGETSLLEDANFGGFTASVLRIEPYAGVDYSKFSLDGVSAVVHGAYHSGTAATNPYVAGGDCSRYSILHLKEMCDRQKPPIPLFMEPCDRTVYQSTGDALRGGILPICSMTSEMAYVKCLIGCSMGLSGDALYEYIQSNKNNEHLY